MPGILKPPSFKKSPGSLQVYKRLYVIMWLVIVVWLAQHTARCGPHIQHMERSCGLFAFLCWFFIVTPETHPVEPGVGHWETVNHERLFQWLVLLPVFSRAATVCWCLWEGGVCCHAYRCFPCSAPYESRRAAEIRLINVSQWQLAVHTLLVNTQAVGASERLPQPHILRRWCAKG